jgi:putative transposase
MANGMHDSSHYKELIFHSDRGVPYACKAFRNILQSMSRKGNCWDNAVTERFFKTLKVERVYRRTYSTRKEAGANIFQYIEG